MVTEMTIHDILVTKMNQQYVVVLKEANTNRCMPMFVDAAEANAIAVGLLGIEPARPLSHDLLCSVIASLGGSVSSVVADRLDNEAVCANLVLDVAGRQISIDCRMSDGLAVASRSGIPIYVEERLVIEAGMMIDTDTGSIIPYEPESQIDDAGTDPDSLSVYEEAIDNLDLSGLDDTPP